MNNQQPPPDLEHVKTVCKIGQGAECCRYLTFSGRGWSCEKKTTGKALFDRRVAQKLMVAQSDNCAGRGHQ